MPFPKAAALAGLAGFLAATAASVAEADTSGGATEVSGVEVTARFEAARQSIQPALGATSYTVTEASIQTLPGGDNQALNQVLLQLPGVVQDGFGQFHVRDDHNNLQYRINGVILPEGLSVFGQALSPRLVDRLSLVTGALPAQYGLRTAGIVDINVRSRLEDGGEVSIYGGSQGLLQPGLEYGGTRGDLTGFLSASYRRSDLGLESIDGSSTPLHDRTDQVQSFGYLSRVLGPEDQVTLIAGYSNQRFQIPNPRGLQPDGTFVLAGRTDYPSEALDQSQRETTGFLIASLLHVADRSNLQTSVFSRYSTLTYRPDTPGELLYNGLAEFAARRNIAAGVQLDGLWRLSDAHTLRAGAVGQAERATSRTRTQVFPADINGLQTSDIPLRLDDATGRTQTTWSAYVQDEWKPAPGLTLNYGLRFDLYAGYRRESQLSPRINAVWTPWAGGTLHAGYARYFSPPPFEKASDARIASLDGTTGAALSDGNTTPFAERQHYFDVGLQQVLAPGLVLGVDAYWRRSRNLIDEGQFGAPIVLTPFNYRDGRIEGLEASLVLDRGPLSAYANFAVSRAEGRNIVSSQFNFDPAERAYIAANYIFLDHDQTYTASAGASWGFSEGLLADSRAGFDVIYGSGLRTEGATPNGGALPDYIQVNLGLSHAFGPFEARVDVINLFDRVYLIRDGSGVGVGAPQYGPRRGVFAGLTRRF